MRRRGVWLPRLIESNRPLVGWEQQLIVIMGFRGGRDIHRCIVFCSGSCSWDVG